MKIFSDIIKAIKKPFVLTCLKEEAKRIVTDKDFHKKYLYGMDAERDIIDNVSKRCNVDRKELAIMVYENMDEIREFIHRNNI